MNQSELGIRPLQDIVSCAEVPELWKGKGNRGVSMRFLGSDGTYERLDFGWDKNDKRFYPLVESSNRDWRLPTPSEIEALVCAIEKNEVDFKDLHILKTYLGKLLMADRYLCG